ncbi:MAG: tetratricopeptide repeat protein, partial [Myxococcota bacterium]
AEADIEAILASGDAGAILRLGDAARLARRVDLAERAYRTVRERHGGGALAARAAFALGRLAFDVEGDAAAAARWFSAYLAEAPGGALARDAQGRLMEAQYRAGNATAAREAARTYLERYPNGPHRPLAESLRD